jgi:S1-C subfamily serine protease
LAADSNAATKAGLKAGDVLLKYAGIELASAEQLGKLMQENANAKSIELGAGATARRRHGDLKKFR